MRAAKRNGGSTIFLMAFAALGIALLPPQDSSNQQAQDSAFATKAASSGLAEMQLGVLAQRNGASPQVRDFGKRIELEGIAADDQLRMTADRSNISLPDKLNKNQQTVYNELSKLSGEDFDKAFVREVVDAHQKDLTAFSTEASSGKNADVKKFAAQTLPILQDQLNQAETMQEVAGTAQIAQ